MKLPSKTQMFLVTVFTMVETVVLTGWLAIGGVNLLNYGSAAAFLCAGLLAEHTLAVIAGNSGGSDAQGSPGTA